MYIDMVRVCDVCDCRCRTQNWCQAPPWNKDLGLSHSALHVDPLRAHSLMTCHIALYHVSSCLTKPHDALWLVGRSSCLCGGSPQWSGWCVCEHSLGPDCNQNSSSTKAGFLKDTLRWLSFISVPTLLAGRCRCGLVDVVDNTMLCSNLFLGCSNFCFLVVNFL